MQTNPTRSAVNAELQMWGIYISHEHHQRLSEASTWEKTAFLMMMRYIITIITTTSTYWCSALTCSVPENCQTLHRFLVAGSFCQFIPDIQYHSLGSRSASDRTSSEKRGQNLLDFTSLRFGSHFYSLLCLPCPRLLLSKINVFIFSFPQLNGLHLTSLQALWFIK